MPTDIKTRPPVTPNKEQERKPPRYAIVAYHTGNSDPVLLFHLLTGHLLIDSNTAMSITYAVLTEGHCVCQVYGTRDMAETILADAVSCIANNDNDLLVVEPVGD